MVGLDLDSHNSKLAQDEKCFMEAQADEDYGVLHESQP